jgi:hypothetical protein
MHYIIGSYTTYYNIRHGRCGHLFQGRFKSIIVEKDSYFLELSRYIHLNPVRAGIVKNPEDYIWSSYSGYMGRKDANIDINIIKQYFDMNRNEYQRFVLDGIKNQKDPLQNVYAGFLLGSEKFIIDKLNNLKSQITSEEVVNKKDFYDYQERTKEIIATVTEYYHTTMDSIRKSRTRPMRGKYVLIYLLRSYTGLTNKEIGELVNMRYPAVSKAFLKIKKLITEDLRLKRTIEAIVSNFQV